MDERLQKGQAIVLIAIMLAVVVGMAALAIDGARAYALRRDLQAAVDAAALAAGDKLQQTGSYTSAEQAATAIFGTNMRLYSVPACSPGYGTPGPAPVNLTCTYPDGTVLTQVVASLGPRGSQFTLAATRSLQLQFARILTDGSNPKISATAGGGVNNLLNTPTIAALNQAGCGGAGGTALLINGGGTLGVMGDVVSNGAISVTGGGLQVAGDIYARCQTAVPGAVSITCYPSGAFPPCTYPDVAGATRTGYNLVDPGYPPPPVAAGSQGAPGSDVVLSPGIYAANPNLSSGVCYFLSAGVYKWLGGYTNNGDFVSNQLKPPAEPKASDNTKMATHQFWNSDGANCAGSYQLSTISTGNPISKGAWAIEVTSVRSDTYNGTSYRRESAPSYCQTANAGNGQALQIRVSNVPGATSYDVYLAPPSSGCAGPFGFAGSIPVAGSVRNDATGGCPAYSGSGCSLGNETAIFDSTVLTPLFAPNPLAPPDTFGAYPPSSETGPLKNNLPNQNPDRAAPPAGDRANEDQCDAAGGALATCPTGITPGAVAFYIPSGGCLSATTSGDNFVFSGYQYNWMVIYEPGAAYPPANTCSNSLAAFSDSAFIGVIYVPSAALTVQKAAAFRTDDTGGIIADTITFNGQLPNIIFSTAFAPVPPATQLIN